MPDKIISYVVTLAMLTGAGLMVIPFALALAGLVTPAAALAALAAGIALTIASVEGA